MDKKFLGIIVGIAVIIGISAIVLSNSNSDVIIPQKTNEKIGLVDASKWEEPWWFIHNNNISMICRR